MLDRKALLLLIGVLCILGNGQAAHVNAPDGYIVQDTIFPLQSGDYVAGFDRLPNNNFAAFVGNRVVEVTPGGYVSTLYEFNTPVFGSFVKVLDDKIYFGESSNGTIWRMSLDGTNPELIGTLENNFDMEFNSLGQAFVSANPGWAGQKVFYFDGKSDEIITGLLGYSGPLAFDSADNLIYATAWASGGDSILRFNADDVAGAIGPTSLTPADAEILVKPINCPYDMELDVYGNIFFSSGGAIYRLADGAGAPSSFAAVVNPYDYLTTVRYCAADNSISVLVGGESYGVISTILPVPEPSSLLGVALGLGLLTRALRKRREMP